MTRRGWLFGSVAGLAALAGAGGAWWQQNRSAGAGLVLGADFWEQQFDQPTGGALTLSQFRGHPLLLNFWATWCPPCVEEMPMLDRFYRDHAAGGWQVLGLAIDQPSAVRKFLVRTPVAYPIGLAGLQGTDLIKGLGNTQGVLPFTLLFNAGGQVTARKMGKLAPADLDVWRNADTHA